ncbi:MAG: universal stress protein [Bacteroidota bacterium]|nr:universal stress protein [Bacteroidota bacterium]
MVANLQNIVLVPTDFSEACSNAAHQAIEAAKLLNFKVVLLHVINEETLAYLQAEHLQIEAIDQQLKAMAEDLMNSGNIKVEYLSKEGSIFTTISDVAYEIGANLIYLGTHGKTGIQRFIGSFALKVVISSPVPVVVVQKRPFNKGYKDIILPITSDTGPWEKANWAVYIAKQFNAVIHIFLIGDASETLRRTANQIASFFKKNKVSFSFKETDKHAHFAKQTIDYATLNNADLILIMTNPDKGFINFLLDSFDEEIIFNTSQIPVMCVNPRKLNYDLIA